MKQIVIIGGGISGLEVARRLEKQKKMQITLVEPKEYFEVPFAQLRSLIEPEDFSLGMRRTYNELIPGVKHIQKKAAGIKDKTLILEDKDELAFDYLVLATGSSYPNWNYLKSSSVSRAEREAEKSKESAELEESSTVLIIGGGAVGVELAGEIAEHYPQKKINLVQGGPRLLSTHSEKMSIRVESKLAGMGVCIHKNLRLKETADNVWLSPDGREFKSDKTYLTAGISVNSQWLSPKTGIEKNRNGAVKVNPDLRVHGRDDVFALGDINDVSEIKLGATAKLQAGVAVKNIIKLVDNPSAKLKKYKPASPMGFVTLGKKTGAVQLASLHPHFMIFMKQKDLFAARTLGD